MTVQTAPVNGSHPGTSTRRRLSSPHPPLSAERLGLRPELLEGCRSASLQLGGPALLQLGVTSTLRGEGRSSVARAMACIQAEDYHRSVVLIELDLERPCLAAVLGASPCPGVAELTAGSASLKDVLQPVGPGLTLVVGGALEKPAARTMADILRCGVLLTIAKRFDVVVADLPPLLGCSFGTAAVSTCSDLLLVIRGGVTPVARIREATAYLPVQPSALLNGTHSHLPPWLQRLAAV